MCIRFLLRVVFPRTPWCMLATNSAALIYALFLPANDKFVSNDSNLLFFQRHMHTQTSSGNVENVQARFGSPQWYLFLTLCDPFKWYQKMPFFMQFAGSFILDTGWKWHFTQTNCNGERTFQKKVVGFASPKKCDVLFWPPKEANKRPGAFSTCQWQMLGFSSITFWWRLAQMRAFLRLHEAAKLNC